MISRQKFTKTNARFETRSRMTGRSRRCVTRRVRALIAGVFSRALSVALVISLLAGSTPAAPRTVVAVANDWSVSFGFWLRANGWPNKLVGRQVKDQEKQEDRDAKVSKIQIYPGDVAVDVNERVQFAASAYDSQDNPTGGVKIKWLIQHRGQNRGARISPRGEFEAHFPGSYEVTAEGAGKRAQVTVNVNDVPIRRRDNAAPIRSRQVSSRDVPSQAQLPRGTGIKGTPSDGLIAKASKALQRKGRKKLAHTAAPLLPDEGWGDGNYLSADDPGNRVGDAPGGAMDEGAGSGNFQIAAPVLGLRGRGIDISLGLAYNSRLWNKAGTQIGFDNDRGWPAPGWSLGFSKLLGMGVYNGGMIVEADGTRHSYTGSITEYSWGTSFVGHTTDGTFIDYSYTSGTGGGIVSAQAKLPNGTVINYGAPGPGAVYPTSIQDPNGNYITITYVNNAGPRIQTIADTLNRPINFHYDASNLLTAITGPGLNNTARTLVRLHYRQLALNYSFSGLTASVRDSNPWVIDAIYYPGTNTGYWFGDSDSYSTYGMIAKVSERRNMSLSAASLNEQGTITSTGLVNREEVYSYPLTTSDPGGSGLTDAPTYPSMTESWTRDGTNTDQAVTNYSSQPNASPRIVTITLPNGTRSTQYSHNYSSLPDSDPLKALDGVVYQDQTFDANNNLLQSSVATWERGAYESPRPTRVEATNERLQMTAMEFSYGSVYNQVTEVRNYDYGGASLLRATRTQYQNSANYTGRHIFSLPLVVEVFAGDGVTRVSRTDYQYDGQTLTARPDVVQHDLAFNTNAVAEGYCYWESDWSDPDCNGACPPDLMGCDGHCPQIYYCPYNPATDYRGNVTQVTSYADAVNLTGPVTDTRRYDITGNLVTASASCCQQTNFNYTVDTQYAYPLSQTRGSASDPFAQVTTSATYDFNTGLVLSATDANGRTSQTSYFAETLRPQTASLPSGAHTDYAYNDTAMSVTESTYLESHPTHTTVADQNIKLLNGRGQVRQEKALGAGGVWDIVDATYDNMGRVSQQTQPYRNGDGLQLSTSVYDALSRVVSMQAPDGSTTQSFYNETARPDVASSAPGDTTRVVDAWGRERWGRTDAQGRLVEVVEPNPGSGSVATGGLVTTYNYNTLGNLTSVIQGAQTRSFQYDSLGRLTAQKLAETSATLNGAAQYVGSGTWGDLFTYDDRSNLISRTDARGVKTVYNYGGDPLNRLQSVSWDTSGFGDTANPILSAATVSYQYRTKSFDSQLLDITQLNSVTTTGVSTESYSYDAEARVSSKTLTLSSRPSYPFVTDYIYDNLDRIEDVRYPAEYGNGSQPRKVVHHDYDVASRLTQLKVDVASHASQIVYNAASQTTSLSVGASGGNQIIEGYSYDQQTGLLANQTVARSSTPTSYLLNLSYDYAGPNGKRTGQLAKILNNLNHNKDRGYSYDALGRLITAQGGPSTAPLWTQNYSYDRYGNRTSVSASGYSASNRGSSPSGREGLDSTASAIDPQSGIGKRQLAMTSGSAGVPLAVDVSSAPERQSLSAQPAAEPQRSSHHASRAPRNNSPDPQGGPPAFTDPDLLALGGIPIKALHITQLRTAINDLRIRLGMAVFSWQTSATSGGFIKADPIIEMRTALDQALGPPPSPGYAAGLGPSQPILAIHIQELRDRVVTAWNTSSEIPRDGHASISYDAATNRIVTAGFAYDAAGNQVRAVKAGGGSQRFQYDAANRLVKVQSDDNTTVLASYTYGDSNERLMLEEGGSRTFYACDGKTEYTESGGSTTPQWSKSYVYLGARLLSTLTPNGAGGEFVQYHHPDRLGTRLVTNGQDTTAFEQVSLPFGTPLNAESTGSTNRRFTTYDRSATTGLDYALNRYYDVQQGRFTQVDPIEMASVEIDNPQTLNLYAYCANDPVNSVDPSGLGFFSFLKKVFKGIWKVITSKWFMIAVTVALTVISFGASMGWWALAEKVTKIINIGMDLGHGTHLATTTAMEATKLGWIAAGLSTAAAIPAVTSVNSMMKRMIAFGVGEAVGSMGGTIGVGGTPDWNPANDFRRRSRRPRQYRGPGSWWYGWRPVRIAPPPRPPLGFRGLNQNRPFAELTHGEIYAAFRDTPFTPSNHAIMRLRDPRTAALGIRTPNDYANSLNRGISSGNFRLQFDGTLGITHGRFETIVTSTGRIVTITPR